MRAELDEPVRLGTSPGETIKVAWQLVDQEGRSFGASGIYLRLTLWPALVDGARHRALRRWLLRSREGAEGWNP